MRSHAWYRMLVYQRESREAVSLRLRYPRAGNRVLVTDLVTVATPACKTRPCCRSPSLAWTAATPLVGTGRPNRMPLWSALVVSPRGVSVSICSVDQWSVSGQCARVRIRRSASCPVSGLYAIVPYRPTSP